MHWATWKLTLKLEMPHFCLFLLSLVSALSMIFCIGCPVLSHGNGYVWGFHGRKFSPYISVSCLVSTPEIQLILEEEQWGRKTILRKAEWSPGEPKEGFKGLNLCSPRLRGRPRTCQSQHGSAQEVFPGSSALELYPFDLCSVIP